jgi:hypothetical protein
MNTMLSMPRTISKASNVKKAIQGFGVQQQIHACHPAFLLWKLRTFLSTGRRCATLIQSLCPKDTQRIARLLFSRVVRGRRVLRSPGVRRGLMQDHRNLAEEPQSPLACGDGESRSPLA